MRLGIAHHLGWAVVVSASDDHVVVDRRRVELIEPGLPGAPVHHVGGPHAMHQQAERLTDEQLATLVAEVRTSAERCGARALDELAGALGEPIRSISLRAWPADLPTDIAVLREVPYESQADSVMYREVLAGLAHERGWAVHVYDAKTVEAEAAAMLGERAEEVLHGPRRTLGPPWAKDHRVALAATVIAV